MRGRFITFEGIDGAGKTTIIRRIEPELRSRGYRVVITTEPTRTWLGDAVKRSYDDDIGPLAETFLFLADRARHTIQIREWLARGATVVSDRYADSTYAYQGARLRGIVRRIEDEFFAPLDAKSREALHGLLLQLACFHDPRCGAGA